jgi:hypothetical protein
MMDEQVIEKFNQFKKDTDYSDLDLGKVEFEKAKFDDNTIFKFIKGLNKYVKIYINKNPGHIPVLGSSLENNCISSYILPIASSDVINETAVSFNKDNVGICVVKIAYSPELTII